MKRHVNEEGDEYRRGALPASPSRTPPAFTGPQTTTGGPWLCFAFRFFQKHKVSTKWLTWLSIYFSSTGSGKRTSVPGSRKKTLECSNPLKIGPFLNSGLCCSALAGFSPWNLQRFSVSFADSSFTSHSLKIFLHRLLPVLVSLPVSFNFLLLCLSLTDFHIPFPPPRHPSLKLHVPAWNLPGVPSAYPSHI